MLKNHLKVRDVTIITPHGTTYILSEIWAAVYWTFRFIIKTWVLGCHRRGRPQVRAWKKTSAVASCLDPHCKCHSSTGVHAFPKSHRPSACSLRDRTKPWWASLLVQGLRLWAPTAGGLGSIPGQGMQPLMPQLRACMLQGRPRLPQLTPSSAKHIHK